MRNSFVFYKSFYESIKELAPKEQAQIYNAIFEYQFYGNEIELKGVCKSIFTLILPQLDANNKRYENGKKGGRPKGNQNETEEKPKGNQNETEVEANENDNVNVNDNDNVNVNVDANDNEKSISNNDLFTYLEKTFGRPLGSAEYELASKWEDNDLTRYAIKQAELARVFNVKYIDKILYSYKKDNITTIADAEKRNEEYQENKDKKGKYEYKSAFERKWEDQRKAEEIFLRGE